MSGISLPGDADQPTRDVWFGPYCLKPARRQLAVGDRPLPLGGRALDLLIALVERAGEVVSRRELMARVWPDVIVEEANLRVHLSALRKALGDGTGGARYITNVPGRGYSFVAPVQRSAPARGPTKAEPAPLPGRGLPPRLERMVGRDQAVTELCELLRSTRFVSIVASGGMGKTTVAIAAAHALAPEFSNDCCFVDLAAVGEGALVPVTVASALGCYGQGENPLPGLLAFLAGRRLLLILDNCEHVIDAIAPLAENVFKNADQVHLLTTSREALRVDGENVHLLAPLEFPEDDKDLRASTALSSPAIQLFMERAAASGHRLTVDDADARTVAQICRRLDGIALAIELAAGRVGSHGIAGTADLLDNRFKLLWHGRRSALPRHQTLEAMLDWSYNLLAEFERSVLRRLSVFVGVFSLDDALAVVADNAGNEAQVADAIESLVDKSLISTSNAGGTAYRLLDTTRAYGVGKLRALGEQDAFARRHAQHYANLLGQEGVRATAFGTHRVAAYAPMMGNIRAGLAWSFSASGDQAIGISLAASAAPLLLGLSLLSECEHWCDLAIKLLPASGRDSPRELDLLVPLAISSMFTRGNTEAVRAGIERGLALADSLCDRQHQMDLLAGLNIFLTRIADFAGAVRSAERSALVAAEAGDPAAEIMAEWMVGVSHHLAGNQAKAQHHCERGFELASSLGELDIDFFGYDHRVRALVALARALWLRGMPRRALQAAQQALDEAGRRDHPVNVCIALIYTTPVFLWLGDFDRAEQCIERLLVHSEKHSLRPYNAVGTALKGELLTLQGDAHTGVRLLRSALATLQAERHHILATVFARALAESLARLGEFEEALSIINKAVERADPSATFDLPDLLRARGEILLAASPENRSAAEASLVRALEIGQAQSAVGWQLRAAVPLARLWLDDGTPERGRALLTELVERFNKERDTPDVVEARNVLESLQT